MSSIQDEIVDTIEETVHEGKAILRGDAGQAARGNALPTLHFSTGLATEARSLPRQALGMGTQLVVPPGTWAVVHTKGDHTLYTPGSYWLWGTPGAVLAQWVDARRQQTPVGPVEGWSADKWRVRIWLIVDVSVADPLLIARHREPRSALIAATRSAALAFIERHTHAALTGRDGETGGMDAPSQVIAERLRNDPALVGLDIINVRVVERQGDERQIEAATAATVAAAQIDEELRVSAARHRARLHQLTTEAEAADQEHTLRMAAATAEAREQLVRQQAEVQQAALAARLDVVMAQIRAQTAEIAHDEQVWQAEQTRLHAEWERVQEQLRDTHSTDQQLRLLEAKQGMAHTEGEVVLAMQDRDHQHMLALAEVQERIAEQRSQQARISAERRAEHERALLDLHLRHEQLVAEQLQKLEQWRSERSQASIQQQRQHDRQLAGIAGAAQIAAAAANQLPVADDQPEQPEVAAAGLRMLQQMTE